MKFIKLEYIDEAIELINLSKVNVIKIGENYISFNTNEKEILVFKNENSFGAIKNFEEGWLIWMSKIKKWKYFIKKL